jgi:hypothetical protein
VRRFAVTEPGVEAQLPAAEPGQLDERGAEARVLEVFAEGAAELWGNELT